jgi:cobalt/nickel transport system ATP-binding protein
MPTSASIELHQVRVFRDGRGPRRVAVEATTLRISKGERVFLLGPNGAGKTSLLLALVGAVPFEGTITIGGTALGPRTLTAIRRRVGLVFADPSDQLFLDEVSEEVAFGPRERGLDEPSVEERVLGALSAVGMDGYRGRAPLELSLGEQRRLAIATALATEPEALLLDEPTAALDPRARRALIALMSKLVATVVVATHDLDLALELGGRAVLIDEGRVVRDGPTSELLVDEALLDAAGLALPLSAARR